MPAPTIKVLLVEDNAGDARLVQEMLAEASRAVRALARFSLTRVERLSQAWEILERRAADIVLLDLTLLDSCGLDTVTQVLRTAPGVPLVVMSGHEDETLALQAVQTGAQDYLVKGHVDSYGLERAIRYAIERQREETEIRRLNADLEQRVRARTAELEAVNQELETFSYSVSHDLRAPVVRIKGFCRILLEDYGGQLEPDGRRYLQRIQAAGLSMEQLIESLLRLAHLTRSEIRRETLDLSALASAIAEELRQSDPARPAEFVIAPKLQTQADARLLRIALENLLGNAWKFTAKQPRGRIEFGQQLLSEPEAGIGADAGPVYFVRDNGVGFEPAHADRLFKAFQRLHAEAEFPGIGIGLATVQRIVQRHGGRVWAQSASGQGATFYFTLGTKAQDAAGGG